MPGSASGWVLARKRASAGRSIVFLSQNHIKYIKWDIQVISSKLIAIYTKVTFPVPLLSNP